MFKHFVGLQWKSFFRSSSIGKSLAVKLLMGFFGLYILGSLALSGAGLYFLLEKTMPGADPLMVVSQYMAYWILAELFLRYFMQKLPVMDIKPFLTLPINKSSITHYILIRSGLSFYNFLTLFFFVPFAIVLIIKDYPVLPVMLWLGSIIGIVFSVNYINFIINKSDKALILVGTLILGLYGIDYFGLFPITVFLGNIFHALYEYPVSFLVPLGIAFGTYLINYRFLRKRIFLDASLKQKTQEAVTSDLAWTRRLGDIAPFRTIGPEADMAQQAHQNAGFHLLGHDFLRIDLLWHGHLWAHLLHLCFCGHFYDRDVPFQLWAVYPSLGQ